MDELQRTDEQLNSEAVPAELDVNEIIAEFSEESDDVKIWTPKTERPEPEPEPEAEPEPELSALPPEPAKPKRERKPIVLSDRGYGVLPVLAAWLLTLLSAAVTLLCERAPFGITLPEPLAIYLPPTIYAASFLLALPELLRGLTCLPKRFTEKSLLLLTALVVAVCGIAGKGGFWAAGSLLLTVSLHGGFLRLRAEARTAHQLEAANAPDCAVCAIGGVLRAPADAEPLRQSVAARTRQDKQLATLSPILAALTVVIAAFFALRAGRDFLWCWSVLLLGAYPLGAGFAYARAFARLSKRLAKSGAAVGGMAGAETLCRNGRVAVTDGDLFPPANLSLNGIKAFGDDSADTLLGYAAALLSCAGAGSAILFERAAEQQHGAHWHANQFLFYDAGGVGGEIGGNVVLLGGRAFFKTMGIVVPEDVKLPHALYIAVNGQAAGVFAVNYRPSDAVRSGLSALLASRAQLLLDSRDVLITPQAVEAIYGVPPERIAVLTHREREALLAPEDAQPGAILTRSGFYPFALAVSGARRLRRAVRGAFAASMLGAALGLLVMTLLTLTDAHTAASAWNLWLYQALWLLPMGVLTQGV